MMELISYKDKILRTPCQTFDFANPPFDPIAYAKELMYFMYEKNGIGLSANQVGDNVAVFAMRGSPSNFVCYNPRIVDVSQEEILLEEGCLSYKNVIIKISRPKRIKVRFQTPNSETLTKVFDGITARVFQHELCHINGKLFCKDASTLRIRKAVDKANKKGSHYVMRDLLTKY